ncbi:MAG: HD domain-containing protein [Pelolinea sp.]|nr:HD domain-containing protein [Pelolinea sp.]
MLTLEDARGWYPEYDAVHGFEHIERVYRICERIGPLENANMEILLTAALLHDASGSHPEKGNRKDHHLQSAEFSAEILREENWPNSKIVAVQHCIRTHRFRKDESPQTIEAQVLFDADKLDVIGAIGVVRTLAYAFQVKQPAYASPSKAFLESGEILPGEPHSAFHEYLFKLKNISKVLNTKTAKQIAKNRQKFLNGFFEELADEMKNIK